MYVDQEPMIPDPFPASIAVYVSHSMSFLNGSPARYDRILLQIRGTGVETHLFVVSIVDSNFHFLATYRI